MKKLLLFAFMAAAPLCMKAQDRAALEQNAQKMIDFTVAGNYPALLELTYPKIFDIVSKEEMLEILPKMMNGDGYTISLLPAAANFKFGEIRKIEGGTYCAFEHDTNMKMAFHDVMEEDEINMMTELFKSNLKTDEVAYDKAQKAFIIKKRAQVIAVADASTGNKWTFVNNDGGKLIPMIFSENVRKQLGL